MEKFSIPAREKDSLELLHDGEIITEVWPYGLWIIGANGRLDLVKGNDIYVVTDQAKTFEAPEWKIADACSRRKIKAFDRSKLNVILDS